MRGKLCLAPHRHNPHEMKRQARRRPAAAIRPRRRLRARLVLLASRMARPARHLPRATPAGSRRVGVKRQRGRRSRAPLTAFSPWAQTRLQTEPPPSILRPPPSVLRPPSVLQFFLPHSTSASGSSDLCVSRMWVLSSRPRLPERAVVVRSGVRCDRHDCDIRDTFLSRELVGPIVPEYPIGSGRVVLRVCLEYLFAIRAKQ